VLQQVLHLRALGDVAPPILLETFCLGLFLRLQPGRPVGLPALLEGGVQLPECVPAGADAIAALLSSPAGAGTLASIRARPMTSRLR
jgi:hypothetical protein